jgi:hypothetical protein
VFAFALPLPVEVKQELLEEGTVEARVRRLLARLEQSPPPPAAPRTFPPGLSPN